MKILYVAPLWEGSTCLDRGRALEAHGVTLIPFDTTPYMRIGGRLVQSLAGRLLWGPPLWKLNRDLRTFARSLGKVDAVWIEKGTWIHPGTLVELRETLKAALIHSTPDPAFLAHQSRHFEASVPLYDLLMTHKDYEMDLYRQKGARRLLYTRITASGTRFRPRPRPPATKPHDVTDITFIGHHEPHYANCLRAAVRVTPRIVIWGSRWPLMAMGHPWMRPLVKGDFVYGEDYPRALCEARIALGLLAKAALDRVTSRSLEIPLCGVFMLAERSSDHQEMFEEGQEAEFFDCPEELEEKARFYLAHEDRRERIARAGRERCLRSGYTSEDATPRLLAEVQEVVGERSVP